MTREEALAHCEELNARSAEGAARWFVQEAGENEWRVVQVAAPGLSGTRGPLKESTEARPRPEADDPRPSTLRQVPPYGAI